ncbi:NAD(P)/FAD-dependent oxidoreductase [Membranihabitans marinus]|uniref:NAD(P)/FAD-dependent oxidoreductase n=1 Tax=Membranihabitans marinus TaxID=1227546 RepID=UPI001F240335|nr:FAD/NAD(P)-binding oxidoreductase [Membranihabitans marinus]
MKNILIIGNGVSGITAARHLRKLGDDKITVISKETDHFFSRTALMYIYMGHMKYEHTKPYEDWFWKKNNISLMRAEVSDIDFDLKRVKLNGKKFKDSAFKTNLTELSYDILILATGSASNKFGWPGQDLNQVHGMYSFQDLEQLEKASPFLKRGVIVGGGLIGIELAEMMHSRHKEVTMLVREPSYWNNVLPPEESEMVNQQIIMNHIDLRLGTELKEILSDDNNNARAVVTGDGEEISCQFVGLTAGVHPNVKWLKDSELAINRGILVDEYLRTNKPDVYAIGDCVELQNPPKGRRAIEPIWYVGRIMGETLAHTIARSPIKYNPGHWFNSAKFLDLEYQVYGNVPANIVSPLSSYFWKSEDGLKSLRLVYEIATNHVVGVNLMGLRFRQEICEEWFDNHFTLEEVVKDLDRAHFDPEFYKKYYKEIETHLAHN